MDTAKAANLFATDRAAELLDYVNPPIGRGKVIDFKLSPLIAGGFANLFPSLGNYGFSLSFGMQILILSEMKKNWHIYTTNHRFNAIVSQL